MIGRNKLLYFIGLRGSRGTALEQALAASLSAILFPQCARRFRGAFLNRPNGADGGGFRRVWRTNGLGLILDT